jgi:Zn-dependent M28 family amino/carboxypeptidase
MAAVKQLITAFVTCLATACAGHPAPAAPTGAAPVAVSTPDLKVGPTESDLKAGPTERSVRGHMEFLASDALNGRGSGTRDEWVAATYIAAHLRRIGLEPLGRDGEYVQDVSIERSVASSAPVLSAGGHRFTHGTEVVVSSLGAPRVSGPLVRYRAGADVPAGAAVLLPEAGSPAPIAVAGAAIVLARETEQARARRKGQAPRSVRIERLNGKASRPVVALDGQAYAVVAGLPDGASIAIDAEAGPVQTTHTWNAAAKLTGSDPAAAGDAILLSAHLDHVGTGRGAPRAGGDTIYNGADDDASGCVAVMELAEALAERARPRRTIVFAWFGSEESGGAGSRAFAEQPPVPLARVIANLQFEMLGRPDPLVPDSLWLTGFERSTLGPELAKRGANLVQDPRPDQNFFERSDNIQFARRGVVAHTVSSFGLHEDYHQPSDELRTIDFGHLTSAIRAMLGPIHWLANSDFIPQWLPGKKP